LIKAIFACTENQNQYKEEVEFEDGTTDAEIEEEFNEWVWDKVGDHFYWQKV
jgi:hypothetical protein